MRCVAGCGRHFGGIHQCDWVPQQEGPRCRRNRNRKTFTSERLELTNAHRRRVFPCQFYDKKKKPGPNTRSQPRRSTPQTQQPEPPAKSYSEDFRPQTLQYQLNAQGRQDTIITINYQTRALDDAFFQRASTLWNSLNRRDSHVFEKQETIQKIERLYGISIERFVGHGGQKVAFLLKGSPKVAKIQVPQQSKNLFYSILRREIVLGQIMQALNLPILPLEFTPESLSKGIVYQRYFEYDLDTGALFDLAEKVHSTPERADSQEASRSRPLTAEMIRCGQTHNNAWSIMGKHKERLRAWMLKNKFPLAQRGWDEFVFDVYQDNFFCNTKTGEALMVDW